MNDKAFASMIDKRFKKSTNPHKFVLLWTSKFYRVVNGCMRNKTVDDQIQDVPHAIYFIQNYIEYFYTHGIHAKDITIKKLFRGYKAEFEVPPQIDDKGFISV